MPVIIDTFEALPAQDAPRRSNESAPQPRESTAPEPEAIERPLAALKERMERVRAH